MRKITINGVDFELVIPRTSVKPFRGWFCEEQAIFMCYDNPSIYKVNIWKRWLEWARSTVGVTAFEITSHNCMTFSIGGLYTDENGQEYNLWITKAHNRAIKVG